MPSTSENATAPNRFWRGSASSCAPASASDWSGPTAAERPRCCGSWRARTTPTPARANAIRPPTSATSSSSPISSPAAPCTMKPARALADLLSLQHEAEEVAREWARPATRPSRSGWSNRYDHLQHELHRQDAYNLDHRIAQVLDGLRFRREVFDQPVASLSGGEQNRLMLAKLLLAEPNVMILDEPSNHLDIDATEWLEGFLVESSAAMIVVSHDRYFLDRVTNRTLELFNGTVDSYAGNFSAYWTQKAERLLVERRTYEKQQIEIEKTKDFIRRNHYGQKHAQAEDRRKKLERIELVPPPREIAAPPMSFPPASRGGDIVVRAEGVAKSYDRTLFREVNVDILRGERWALLGPNGCGKTTLLRCLLGPGRAGRGPHHRRPGHRARLFRSAIGRIGRRRAGGRRRPSAAQPVEPTAAAQSAGPFRADRRHVAANGGQPQRRRAVPGGTGAAGRRRGQFPRPRRADQPPRPLGPRRPGEGDHAVRRHRAVCQSRPLLRQPRGRSPAGDRARADSRDRGELRHVPATPHRPRAQPSARF